MEMERFLPLILLLIFQFNFANAQPINKASISPCDSLTVKEFLSRANKIKRLMDEHRNLTENEAKRMIRIYNTVFTNASKTTTWDSGHLLRDFETQFDAYYYNYLKEKYEMIIVKGGTTYLKKIDLYVGIGPTYRCKDFYLVN
jgi:hypothetical protein